MSLRSRRLISADRSRDTMDPIYAGDDVIDNMISGNKALAVVYSGDASYIISENPNLDYFTPEQGTNRWYDAMVITKDCSEVQLAHEFIDFMISDKSALSNTEEVGYTSTVKSAFETMKEGDYAGISLIFRIQPTRITKSLLISSQRSSRNLRNSGQK